MKLHFLMLAFALTVTTACDFNKSKKDIKPTTWTDEPWIGYAYGTDAEGKYVRIKDGDEKGGLKTYGAAGMKKDTQSSIKEQLIQYCEKMAKEEKWKDAGVKKCVMCRGLSGAGKQSIVNSGDKIYPIIHKP